MNTKSDTVIIVAVKHTVIAFDKASGARLWSKELSSGLGGDFVTVVADMNCVYAHTHGELSCLDLATGAVLWQDRLTGLGYGIASIALPGAPVSVTPALAARIQQERAGDAAATSGTISS